jgi:hypothetical protein
VDALSHRKSTDFVVKLDVWFDPPKVIEWVMGDSDNDSKLEMRRRVLAVAWYESAGKVRSVEVSEAFAVLLHDS